MKTEAIIVDIDGTLTNIKHRLHYIINKEKEKNYKSFYKEMINDKPKQDIIDIVNLLEKNYYIIIMTGRPEQFIGQTVQWLKKYKVNWNELFMRPDNNFLDDYILKESLYKEFIKPFYKVICIFEDRQSVVDMWRKNNLTCFQVHKWKDR